MPQAEQPLTREAIVQRALELAQQDGLENLSARKLAGSFGKTAMALYRHFDSMDEIRQGAVALAYREVDTRPIPGERWDDTLRRSMSSIRQVNLKYARARLSSQNGTAWSPAFVEHTSRINALHRGQGIPERVFTPLWRIVDAYLMGFIENEIDEMQHLSVPPEGDLPAWYRTTEAAYTDQAFQDGIDIIVAGVRALAAPDPCEWRTPPAQE